MKREVCSLVNFWVKQIEMVVSKLNLKLDHVVNNENNNNIKNSKSNNIECFKISFEDELYKRLKKSWHPKMSQRGSAFRCIINDDVQIDSILKKSVGCLNNSNQILVELPKCLSFINPGRVVVKFIKPTLSSGIYRNPTTRYEVLYQKTENQNNKENFKQNENNNNNNISNNFNSKTNLNNKSPPFFPKSMKSGSNVYKQSKTPETQKRSNSPFSSFYPYYSPSTPPPSFKYSRNKPLQNSNRFSSTNSNDNYNQNSGSFGIYSNFSNSKLNLVY